MTASWLSFPVSAALVRGASRVLRMLISPKVVEEMYTVHHSEVIQCAKMNVGLL